MVSINNPKADKVIANLNAHIKSIAASEKCIFVNLENAKRWNTKANLAASSFARNMGMNVRKPLSDLAEILYSYAFYELKESTSIEKIAG